MIKALIWKEWRENLSWAAVVWAVMGLLFLPGFALMGMDPIKPDDNIFAGMEILSLKFAPLAAIVLGYMQISRDSSMDKWAFLVHRPIPRTSIFGGKAIGGLSLYLAAFCLPFLAFAMMPLILTEPRLSFDAQLHYAAAHIKWIMIGANFYFVGMLVAIRRTRWYGSRFLPVLATLAWLMALDFFPPAWRSDWYALLGGLFIGLAVWGGVLTDGKYEQQPRIAKVGLGVTLYLGISTIFAFSFGAPIGDVLFRTLSTFQNRDELRQSLLHGSSHELDLNPHIGAEVFGGFSLLTPGTFGILQRLVTPPVVAGFIEIHGQRYGWAQKQGKFPNGSLGPHNATIKASVENIALLKSAVQNFFIGTIVVGLLCSLSVFLVARRARLSRFETLVWSLSTLFLGITGVLLLLSLREWPPLESCPQCGRKRSIYNERCEYCGAPPRKPELDATSIFEPLTTRHAIE